MPAAPANNCTLEFTNGDTISVAREPGRVARHVAEARGDGLIFIELPRMQGDPGGRGQRDWPDVYVNPRDVRAIYPIDGSATKAAQRE